MQKSCLIAVAALRWLLIPGSPEGRRNPRARWALSGVLPLMHPSLVFASAAWVFGEIGHWSWARRGGERRPVPRVGLPLFAIGVAGCAFWYLRPEPLRLQFLPQAASIGGRSGLFVATSPIFLVPTYATYALGVLSALAALVGVGGRQPTEYGRADCGERDATTIAGSAR